MPASRIRRPRRANAEIRHVVWDWNGTLLDDAHACVEALNGMLRRRGFPPVSIERYRETFGFPVRGFYRKLGFRLDAEGWDGVAREYHRRYSRTCRSAALRTGVRRVLRAFKARGISMSVLSASPQALLDRMIRRHSLAGYFDQVCGLPDLYAHSKLDLGRRLLAGHHAAPWETLIVGDTTHDHHVARELGCRCVLISGGHQSDRRLNACGCPVLHETEDLLTLPGIASHNTR